LEVGPAIANSENPEDPLHFELVEEMALQARAGYESPSRVAGREIRKGSNRRERRENVLPQEEKGRDLPGITQPRSKNTGLAGAATGPNEKGLLTALATNSPRPMLVIGQSNLRQGSSNRLQKAQVYYIGSASLDKRTPTRMEHGKSSAARDVPRIEWEGR